MFPLSCRCLSFGYSGEDIEAALQDLEEMEDELMRESLGLPVQVILPAVSISHLAGNFFCCHFILLPSWRWMYYPTGG